MEQDSTTLLFKVNSELMAVKRIWFSTGMQDVESPLKFGMVDNASINDHERDHGIVNSDWTNTGQSSELMTTTSRKDKDNDRDRLFTWPLSAHGCWHRLKTTAPKMVYLRSKGCRIATFLIPNPRPRTLECLCCLLTFHWVSVTSQCVVKCPRKDFIQRPLHPQNIN